MKIFKLTAISILMSVACSSYANAQNAPATSTAITPMPTSSEGVIEDCANTWLALVDKGQYKDSWSSGSTSLQKGIDQTKWNDTLTQVRGTSGALVERKIKDGSYTQELFSKRGIQVVVLHFAAAFANKPHATETLIMLPTPDGKWHVSGYLLK